MKSSTKANAALEAHMKCHSGQILTAGTFASDEFDRLYLTWRQACWDEGDSFTRRVWASRPT